MKNDDKPGFRRAERFVKRDAHQFNSQREHQKRLNAKKIENARQVISEFLKLADLMHDDMAPEDLEDARDALQTVARYTRSLGFDILKEKDNG